MGRRTSSGRIGAPTFGGLLADAQTITSDDNKDIIFDPTGTGIVKSEGHFQIQNQNSLRFGDADDSNYVAFQAPTTVSSNLTWTLPNSDGSNLQALVTDGSGNLSFQTTGATLNDNASDSATHYPVLSQSTSGTLTTARISSTKFTFQPSTGTLSATLFNETSSVSLKENFRSIDNALEKVMKLTPKLYDRKDGSTINEAGLIAEEVERVFPNLVGKNSEGKPETVSYTRLGVYLLESIKQLKKEVDEIRKKQLEQ